MFYNNSVGAAILGLNSPTVRYVLGSGLGLALCFVVWMVGASLFEEFARACQERADKRQPLTNKKQKPAIRASIARLSSPRRYVRVEGLQLLAQFNDPSCVPALLRVVEMYPDDVPFLVDVVQLLEQLADDRALPVLRKLSVNRHHALTQAAHQALDAIEPRSTLLRAGNAPRRQVRHSCAPPCRPRPIPPLPRCSERARRPIPKCFDKHSGT